MSTTEAPLDVTDALLSASSGDVVLVDCLTLWLYNLMHHERNVETESARMCETISAMSVPVILVSNEVGLGLVPETPLGRVFRDEQARLNQAMAEVCDRVEFIAPGLPITLKD
ncbi:MAG: bifunctional adenosylcobinamide kinase/adenosylcobinamide-phosphate guanylyltransferase [Pseudomonadota bacterium]